jgi:DNA polymerase alpha subunit A
LIAYHVVGEEYVPMFWIDAAEVNGIIYLFGKVIISEPGMPKQFVSCCASVHGTERNLFVLAKAIGGCNPDGSVARFAFGYYENHQ